MEHRADQHEGGVTFAGFLENLTRSIQKIHDDQPVVEFDYDPPYRWLSRYRGLPGFIQVVSSGDKVDWAGRCFPTDEGGIRAAVEYAAKQDMRSPAGVYFRLSTLAVVPTQGRGGADLTAVVPAIMADLDIAGPGHQHANLPPDEAAVRALVAEAGLPDPTTWIRSGAGLYAVWWLDQPVDRALAEELGRRVNEALSRAAQAHGLHVDTVSADTARVYRLVGSRWLKDVNDPRPCVVLEERVGATVHPDEFPVPPPAPQVASAPRQPRTPRDGLSPGDAFAQSARWADLFEPIGWELVGTDSGELWKRPGASSEYSARAFEHNVVIHSEAADLPAGAGQKLTKLRLFTELYHAGDVSAAVKDLIAASRDEACSEAAAGLPDHVLAAIRTAAPSEEAKWSQMGFNLDSIAQQRGISTSNRQQQEGSMFVPPPIPPPMTAPPPPATTEGPKQDGAEGMSPMPAPHPATFYGLLGEVVQRLAPATEAAPVAMLAQLVAYSGALLRDRAFTMVGGSKHPPRIWPLIIGKTSAGRKGESRAQTRSFTGRALSSGDGIKFVNSFSSFDSYFVREHSGLSTGEGLLASLADKVPGAEGEPATWVPIQDAVVITETEFARPLAASKRDNNTLSPVLRDLWDAGRGQTMTKGEPIKIEGAYVVVVGHVTPRELRLKLSEADVAGGLMNRFLSCYAHRTQLLADQHDPPNTADLQRRFKDAIDWSQTLKGQQVARTEAANQYWRKIYHVLAEQEPDGMLGELLARAPAYVLRIALAYALMDKRTQIRVEHLRAALALVDYSIRSTIYVFGGTGDSGDLGRLAAALKQAGGVGLIRSEISKVFSGNRNKAALDTLVIELVKAGHAVEHTEDTGGRGRPSVRLVWAGGDEVVVDPLAELLNGGDAEPDHEIKEENHAIRTDSEVRARFCPSRPATPTPAAPVTPGATKYESNELNEETNLIRLPPPTVEWPTAAPSDLSAPPPCRKCGSPLFLTGPDRDSCTRCDPPTYGMVGGRQS